MMGCLPTIHGRENGRHGGVESDGHDAGTRGRSGACVREEVREEVRGARGVRVEVRGRR